MSPNIKAHKLIHINLEEKRTSRIASRYWLLIDCLLFEFTPQYFIIGLEVDRILPMTFIKNFEPQIG